MSKATSAIVRLLLVACICLSPELASAIPSAAVTLSIAPGSSVVAGTAVTMTATVTLSGVPVTKGTVVFCDATAAHCEDSAIFGRAQLGGAGTASITLIPGAGTYSVAAEFRTAPGYALSISSPQPLTVTGNASYGSLSTIGASGTAGNYTLTGTVTAFGKIVPTGTVSFLDTTSGNAVVGTAGLDPTTLAFTFLTSSGSPVPAGTGPQAAILGDFNNDGNLDLAVANLIDQTVSVSLGNGDGTFQTQAAYVVGNSPTAVAMGDFNQDGNLDLAVVNSGDNTISVLLGNGNGTFATQAIYAVGSGPQSIAIADFNGDGYIDLAVTNEFDFTVSILLGQADGTFVPDTPAIFAVGQDPQGIAAADFNGDGNADLVVTNPQDGSLSVLLGVGNGTFQPQIVISLDADVQGVTVADFNGDGIPDIATVDVEDNIVFVLLGINGLTFQSPAFYFTNSSPVTVAAGDFNGDGYIDLVVADRFDNGVSLFLNQADGTGTFHTQVRFPVGGQPIGIAAGDVNGDGLPDVAIADSNDNATTILLSARSQTAIASGVSVFGAGTQNVLASYPGDASRASSASTTVALTGSLVATTTTFTAAPNPALAGQAVTLTATVTPAPTGAPLGSVSFYSGAMLLGTANVNSSGIATFSTVLPVGPSSIAALYSGNAQYATSTSVNQTVTVDADQSSSTVLSIAPGNTVAAGTAVTLTATVTATFGLTTFPVTQGTVIFCKASAAHCDGAAVYGSAQLTGAGTAAMKLTPGVGTYSIAASLQPLSGIPASTSTAQPLMVTATASYLSFTALAASGTAADYTLTGTVTAFGVPVATGTVSFLDTTNGNAVLGSAALNAATLADVFIPSSGGPLPTAAAEYVVSGDFNNDGIADLAVLSQLTTGAINVFLGNGDGTFQNAVSYGVVGQYPDAMAAADLNGDGNLDLIVTAGSNVNVLLGNGDGTFQAATLFAVGNNARFVAAGDFNHDGVPDLAVTNLDDSTVSVLIGLGDGTFRPQVTYSVPNPIGVAVGDFNHDGILDLAVSGYAMGPLVDILQGVGDGTFVQAHPFIDLPPGTGAYWLAAGDLRNTGTLDLVLPDGNNPDVYVLLGNNDGTFQTEVAYAVGAGPFGVSLGDVNGDGVLDLVVPDTGEDGSVSVLIGKGDGTFAATTDYTVGNNPTAVALADFNGDGLLDIATADNTSNTATILLGARTETAIVTGVTEFGTGTYDVLASYPGDASRIASLSTTVTLTDVPQTVTTTTLTALPNPAIIGQSVTLTATVAPAPTGTPLGSVNFFNGVALLGNGTVDSSGIATLSTSSLPIGADSITAVYSGNAGFAASTSTAVSETVTLAATSTALTVLPNPVAFGQSVTITATVSPAPTGAPLGSVNFFNGVTLLGNGTVDSSGIATLSSSLPVGADSITAVYSGNAGFATSTSTAVSETVTLATTATALTVLPNPVAFGQSSTMTATVSPVPTGAPLGSVNFFNGVTLLGNGALNSSGVATLSTSSLPVGADSITAVYSGNAGFAASTSTAVSETVTLATTATALTVLPNPVAIGQSVTFTATVSPAPTGAPLGSVNFFNGVTLLGNGTVNSSGIATLSSSSLPVGADSITAVYSGNAGFATSTSTAVIETVTLAATTTTLGAAPNPAVVGQSVALTATVAPAPTGAPLGSVNFFNGITLLGNGTVNSSGVATLSTSSLPVGADSITAVYSGNAGFATSTSTAVIETVALAPTATALTVLPNPVAFGQSATLTATVTPAPTGAPLGSVNFFNGVTLLGNSTVNSSGIATFSTSSLPVGVDSITAVYSGNAAFATSTSTAVSETVTLAATATAVVAAPNPGIVGQSATLTATVTPAPTGAPLGSVNFFNGVTLLGNGTVNSSGIATLSTSSLPVGADSITAVYSGNASFAGSTSAAITETVTLDPTTTALTATPNPGIVGQSVMLTATVAPAPTGAPLGTVNFFEGVTLLGNGTVNSSGIATLSTSSLPVGADGITAVYSGNAAFAASTSTAVSETVTLAPTTSALTVLPNPLVFGQSATITATVTPAPTGAPLGTVNFFDGATLLGNSAINSSGIATFATSSLPVGADSITVAYSGNAAFAASTSTAVIETVTLIVTATTLSAAPNPAIVGQSVTLTATVGPAPTGAPLGSVNFFNGVTLLGNATVNSSGIATLSTSSLPVGADSITAVYSGNAGFAASTSTAISEAVMLAVTATTLTVAPSPLFDGQTATLTATISPAPTGTPAGSVNFYNGATLLGSGTVDTSGIATFTTTGLPVGDDSLTAVYSGNGGFAASTSLAVVETVTPSFTVAGPTTPVSVAPGGAAIFDITVPPLGGPFNSLVTLSATGLPPGATVTFTPPTITPGSEGATSVMTIQLPAVTANIPGQETPVRRRGFPAASFGLAFVLFGAVLGRKRLPRKLVLALTLAGLGTAAALLTACGGGFGSTATNYTITVTGTSGSFQASTTVTLTVK